MIKAKIIADSISAGKRDRITTFELEFPRWILAEFNTHRLLSRNSASSRAIPIKANIENILANTAVPVHWGINQAGMVAEQAATEEVANQALAIWAEARDSAIAYAERLTELGIHKQIVNRLIENFTYQKVIVTATNWDNFFWLRDHKDAQPEIRVLASAMLAEYNASIPQELYPGEWHVPYVYTVRNPLTGTLEYFDTDGKDIRAADALKISASCCAQVSYRKSDDSIDKAINVFNRLNLDSEDPDTRKHSSPVEHQGTPINYYTNHKDEKPAGVTHLDFDTNWWSGNFKGWVQYRHTFENESCKANPNILTK